MRLNPQIIFAWLIFFGAASVHAEDAKTAISPYNLKALKDKKGMNFDISQDGSIRRGNARTFDRSMSLFVNGQSTMYMFRSRGGFNNMGMHFKTKNGYHIGPATLSSIDGLSGVHVTRKIDMVGDKQWLRYVDTYENRGNAVADCSIEVIVGLGSDLKAVKTNNNTDSIDDKSWGFSLKQANGRGAAVVFRSKLASKVGFSIATTSNGEGLKLKPKTLKLQPGESVSYCYFVGQFEDDKKAFNKLKKFSLGARLKDLGRDLNSTIINFQSSFSLANQSIDRESNTDLIVLRTDKKVVGTLTQEKFGIETVAGIVEIPLSSFVGLVTTGSSEDNNVLLACTDRQVFSGKLMQKAIGFRLSGGQELNVKLSKIKSIGVRTANDEEWLTNIPENECIARLRNGGILGLDGFTTPLKVLTRCGTVEVKLGDILAIKLNPKDNWGHQISLKNGSQFGGFVINQKIGVQFSGLTVAVPLTDEEKAIEEEKNAASKAKAVKGESETEVESQKTDETEGNDKPEKDQPAEDEDEEKAGDEEDGKDQENTDEDEETEEPKDFMLKVRIVKLAKPKAVEINRHQFTDFERVQKPKSPISATGSFKCQLWNGDQIVCLPKGKTISISSDLGDLKIDTSLVRTLSFSEGGLVDLTQWDGTELGGRLNFDVFQMTILGQAIEVPVNLIKEMEQSSYKLPADLEADVAKIIADLDSRSFQQRDRAALLLKNLGSVIRSYLEVALAKAGISAELNKRLTELLKDTPPLSDASDIDINALRAMIRDSKNSKVDSEKNVVAALKSIHQAQLKYQREDSDGNEEEDFADMAALAKHLGKDFGIDEDLGKGEKFAYLFATGPSSDEESADVFWWATAIPKNGKGKHYFLHYSGTIFVSEKPFTFSKVNCDRPEGTKRLEE